MADLTLPDLLGAITRLQDFDARDQRTNDLCMQLMAQQAETVDRMAALVVAVRDLQTATVQALQGLSIKVELPAMPEPPEPPEPPEKPDIWADGGLQVSISQGQHAMPKVMTITKAK